MIELFRIAVRNVKTRKKRTALTMLGIFIGIAAVVALVALGQGFQSTINEQFEKIGADKIIVQPKQSGYGGLDAPGKLTTKEVRLAGRAKGVMASAGQIYVSGIVKYNDIQRTRFLMSTPDDPEEYDLVVSINTWEVEEGRLLTTKDKGKVVIGHNLANNKVFQKNIPIGSKIEINDEKFRVSGIFKKTGDPGLDGGIAIAEEDLRRLVDDEDGYSAIYAQSGANEDPERVAENVNKEIRKDRHQKEGQENFEVQTSTELIESFNKVLNIVQVVFIGIALISLLVGGIGIMNTMYTAVLERTREIAIMKAIGAKNGSILKIFLFESGILGAAGGIIGIILGVMISKFVEIGVNFQYGEGTLYAAYPLYLIFGTLIFAVGIGMLSGYLPAKRASKLQPADCLRTE